MPTVLITRPQTSSEPLAHELQAQGYDGVIEPLLSIVLAPSEAPDFSLLQATMITSAHALEALKMGAYNLEALLNYPCFCVGPRTADKARAFGFNEVINATSDGTALAQLIHQSLTDKTKPLLYICGHDVDSKAKDHLQSAGFNIISWPIYMAVAVKQLVPHTIKLIEQQKLDAILLFSVRTAETLKTLLQHHKLEACCQGLIAIGLSEAIKDVLKPLSWRKLIAAKTPTEDAVIESLKETLPVS